MLCACCWSPTYLGSVEAEEPVLLEMLHCILVREGAGHDEPLEQRGPGAWSPLGLAFRRKRLDLFQPLGLQSAKRGRGKMVMERGFIVIFLISCCACPSVEKVGVEG